MLTRAERSNIKSLMQSATWGILKNVQKELCDKLAYEPKSRETNDETIRTVYRLEGQIEGIKRYFQELDNIAAKANED